MDGYEATDIIRGIIFEHNLEQPIIAAVTGHTESMYTEKALNSGMNLVLFKPVEPTELKKLLIDLKYLDS